MCEQKSKKLKRSRGMRTDNANLSIKKHNGQHGKMNDISILKHSHVTFNEEDQEQQAVESTHVIARDISCEK